MGYNGPFCYFFSVTSCDTFDDRFARICVPNKERNMNVKAFNLMLRVNDTRLLVQHDSSECKCRLE